MFRDFRLPLMLLMLIVIPRHPVLVLSVKMSVMLHVRFLMHLVIFLKNFLIVQKMKSKILWWLGLIVALISAAIIYCSCTAGITFGRANSVTQTVTNSLDSTVTTFSLMPQK